MYVCVWGGGGEGGRGRKDENKGKKYSQVQFFMNLPKKKSKFCDFVVVTKDRSLTTLPTNCMSQNSNYLLEIVLRVSELVGTLLCSKVILSMHTP